jgi:tRNA (mo5U34)-methyltransferase
MQELQQAVDRVGFWWHSIDLGGGVITPGRKGDLTYMAAEHASLRLPDLRGRSVLDVGCWDGYYAFAAERAGAARVTALDHYAWEQPRLGAGRGFDVAHAALASRVHKRHADFMTCELAGVDRHDVVLFLGVLYHLEEPLSAVRRLREVTGELAVIATTMRRTGGRPTPPPSWRGVAPPASRA